MFELTIKSHFEAAHFLKNYQGKCENLHGHFWRVEATFGSQTINPQSGLAVDFIYLKKSLGDILEKIDHTFLNKNAFLKGANPSCENLAKFLFLRLKKEISNKFKKNIQLLRITVWESEDAGATYYEK